MWPRPCPKWTWVGQGRGFGRSRLQAGLQLRHRVHRPRPQAKAGYLRYPCQGKGCLVLFRCFLREYGGDHNNIAEVVCDMSPAFLVAIGESFPSANVTVN
ncbi:hypothetical protein DFAR_3460025 [Desulfarculales bacterium]